eukprot:CAMPEP_0205804106 /NCGR_PEP_ID=MMETSP0205-20121125/6902_1 /ASSEMBLY_ACC=CAM_ASM_000278 /TAXON_ID=36767 /ORGANISM="Euplotes focardii, Strain TN1" /LENGTH=168 /DNA_ID=CAMNT_0053073137 /DNA_START=52 /DNA_END=558 /DNA_ORIENTATION=-
MKDNSSLAEKSNKFTISDSKQDKNEEGGSIINALSPMTPMNKNNSQQGRNEFQLDRSSMKNNSQLNFPILDIRKNERSANESKIYKFLKKNKNVKVLKAKNSLTTLKSRIQSLYDKYYISAESIKPKKFEKYNFENTEHRQTPIKPYSRNVELLNTSTLPPLAFDVKF